jgi:hypothetical protein
VELGRHPSQPVVPVDRRSADDLVHPGRVGGTPNMPPNFQGIQLTGNGSGRIIDANPRLGGEFDYLWGPPGLPGTPGATYYRVPAQPNGDWYINVLFC